MHPRRVRKTKQRPDHHTATPSPACDLLAGADVNARSQWWAGGFGLLHTADPELAAYAIERGAVVDVHAAARLGRLDRLRELIEGDPRRVHARGDVPALPLGWATHGSEHGWHRRTGNYPAVVAALLEAGAMLLGTASGTDPVKEVLRHHGIVRTESRESTRAQLGAVAVPYSAGHRNNGFNP
ncbi:MAG: hypothetical protein WBQ11_24380, partial [Isosphaeraceae bacterium]